jgi:hypothetical protein
MFTEYLSANNQILTHVICVTKTLSMLDYNDEAEILEAGQVYEHEAA